MPSKSKQPKQAKKAAPKAKKGKTVQHAAVVARNASGEHLDVRLFARVTLELADRLEQLARQYRGGMSDIIRWMVEDITGGQWSFKIDRSVTVGEAPTVPAARRRAPKKGEAPVAKPKADVLSRPVFGRVSGVTKKQFDAIARNNAIESADLLRLVLEEAVSGKWVPAHIREIQGG